MALVREEDIRIDIYTVVDPRTGRPYKGPCHRDDTMSCHPAIYVVEEPGYGQVPCCFECLTPEERTEAVSDLEAFRELMREVGVELVETRRGAGKQ